MGLGEEGRILTPVVLSYSVKKKKKKGESPLYAGCCIKNAADKPCLQIVYGLVGKVRNINDPYFISQEQCQKEVH